MFSFIHVCILLAHAEVKPGFTFSLIFRYSTGIEKFHVFPLDIGAQIK